MTRDVTLEETGANTETDKQFIYNTYTELLENVEPLPGMNKTETFEDKAKALFIKEPANMKLLVVVDKLLTGFDVPPCTYMYIDKKMQDHGLFQAICRTNRLDGEDKDYGYIVDYKDLFKKVENAIEVYTSELDHSSGGVEPEVMLQERLQRGKERLDLAVEALVLLCEPVEPPKGELDYIHYFCGNTREVSLWSVPMQTSQTIWTGLGIAPQILTVSKSKLIITSMFERSFARPAERRWI
jgi:type I restriction enzyme R subunit